MDADEIKRRLAEAGIPVGQWGASASGEKGLPPALQRQRDALQQIKAVLEGQLTKDRAQRAEMYTTMTRLKHGGGR